MSRGLVYALLCVSLCLAVALPRGVWAGEARRDLEVEALREVEVQRQEVTLWVLAIGVSDYADERIDLEYADNDAEMIARMLATQQGVLFQKVNSRVLVNEQATREEILRGMSEFLGQASSQDVVLIFMAGHGLQDRQTQTYYFVPHNANARNLIYNGLPMPMFDEACKRLQSHVDKLVLWLDTCHAGALSVSARGVDTGEDLAEALDKAQGRYILSASMAGEESLENESYRMEGEERAHGAFTYSLLRGLSGQAADDSGVVWLSDLFSHVSKEVPLLTTGQQHPYGDMRGTNLPLFVVGGEPTVDGQTAAAISLPVLMTPKKKGSRKWLWLLPGAAVIGGGAVIGLSGGGDTAPGSKGLPTPPAHPDEGGTP